MEVWRSPLVEWKEPSRQSLGWRALPRLGAGLWRGESWDPRDLVAEAGAHWSPEPALARALGLGLVQPVVLELADVAVEG